MQRGSNSKFAKKILQFNRNNQITFSSIVAQNFGQKFVIATQSGIFHLKATKAVVEVVVVVVVVPLIAKTKKL